MVEVRPFANAQVAGRVDVVKPQETDNVPESVSSLAAGRRKWQRHNRSPGVCGVTAGVVGLGVCENLQCGGLLGHPYQHGEVGDHVVGPLARLLHDVMGLWAGVFGHGAIVTPATDTIAGRSTAFRLPHRSGEADGLQVPHSEMALRALSKAHASMAVNASTVFAAAE